MYTANYYRPLFENRTANQPSYMLLSNAWVDFGGLEVHTLRLLEAI
jgi:hypothetical protein